MVSPLISVELTTTHGQRVQQVRKDLYNLIPAAELFWGDVKRPPSSTTELIQAGQIKGWHGPYFRAQQGLTDPWGIAYVLRGEGNRCVATSCGPDGTLGTLDDISSEDKPE